MTDVASTQAAAPWVPAGGLLLHIGPHKTGTTAVQESFHTGRQRLAARGIVYPGPSSADHTAVRARLRTPGGWDDAVPPPRRGRWARLRQQTEAADGTVVVSSEAFCHATRRQASAVLDELRPARPHRVVITVRPFAEVLPSAYQEYTKAGWTTDYDTFLRSVLLDAPGLDGPTPTFWMRHDHGRLARRWAATAGAANVCVVVSDVTRPADLLAAFETVLGLPAGELAVPVASANRSLSMLENELLRRVNERVRGRIDWRSYNLAVRLGALPRLLADRSIRAGEARFGLPAWAAEAAEGFAAAAVRHIGESGATVIGDLDTMTRRIADVAPDGAVSASTDVMVPGDVVHLLARGMVEGATAQLGHRPEVSLGMPEEAVSLPLDAAADLLAHVLVEVARQLEADSAGPVEGDQP